MGNKCFENFICFEMTIYSHLIDAVLILKSGWGVVFTENFSTVASFVCLFVSSVAGENSSTILGPLL